MSAELHNSSWSSDNNMWSLWSLQLLDVFLDWDSTEEYLRVDVWHVLGESFDFILDLISKLSSVTENQSGVWLWVLLELLQDRNDEHCGLSHTRDSLTDDVSTDNSLWNALLLNLRGMLKSAINDSSV